MRRLPAVVCVGLLLACRETSVEPSGSIRVSAEVSRSAFRAGEPVTIRVHATNVGTAPVELGITGCPAWFEILSGSTRVAPGATACLAMAEVRNLAPGGSHSAEYEWHGGAHATPTTPAVPLLPGTYDLRGRVTVGGDVVRSAPVEIRILR